MSLKKLLRLAPMLLLGSVLLPISLSPTVLAACSDYRYQEDAQAALRAGESGLDRDGDNIACETLPRRGNAVTTPSAAPDNLEGTGCPSFVPKVNPYRLSRPVLLGSARASYYYRGVILAGNKDYVSGFLDCYGLTVAFNSNYASATSPIWGACAEVADTTIVCVAVNSRGVPSDSRIFSAEYADKVGAAIDSRD